MFENEMHTLKGLSSTLGMELLSTLAENLQHEKNEEILLQFSKILEAIITDLT